MKTDAEMIAWTDEVLYRLLRRWLWRATHGLVPSKTVDVAALLREYDREGRSPKGNGKVID